MIKYGAEWPNHATDLEIEMACIRAGGKWVMQGIQCGLGDIHHYEQVRRILWPELDDHRWHRLTRDEILNGKIVTLAGCGSSGKTHAPAWIRLVEWMCFPEITCVLVSSETIGGLRKRIWAEIGMLWQQAKDRYGDIIPGNLFDSALAITTDSLQEKDWEKRRVRDMRKGIFGIACKVGGKMVGLTPYIGIKQKKMRLIFDEAQTMPATCLSAFSNLNQNEDFKASILGNFNDPVDALGRAACPKVGWSSYLEPTKTSAWDTEFMNGRCVNLIGLDSPNFDDPAQPNRYKYLIGPRKISEVLSGFPKDSYEYMSQCVGSMKISTLERRVISRDLCRKYGALKDVVWLGDPLTKIGGMDSAYGGDRCVLGHITFGKEIGGTIVISITPPVIVPIRVVRKDTDPLPEEQIAEFVKDYCETNQIHPSNFFHDSTGRGTLGTFLARAWSDQTNPVEFGGSPTDRPVGLDLWTDDPATGDRRPKLCREHYSKFVTELWWSVRYAIECGQIRNLPEDVMDEGCMRMWDKVAGDKYEVESKIVMKERVGRSPDLFDWLSICVEGARRRGFQIERPEPGSIIQNLSVIDTNGKTISLPIPNGKARQNDDNDWLERELEKQRDFAVKHQLSYDD